MNLLIILLVLVNGPNAETCDTVKDKETVCKFTKKEKASSSSSASTSSSRYREIRLDVSYQPSMALVLYDESALSPFHKETRTFRFGENDVHIRQRWKEIGVAAVVWDAAIVLGEYIDKNSHLIKNKCVIELGAGTGLAGIVAAIKGGNIITTERKIALEILKENVNFNMKNYPDLSLKVEELEWGKDLEEHTAVDVIIGADIIYIEETFQLLLQTLLHLSDSFTVILLSCKIRYERDSQFIGLMKEHFKIEEVYYDNQRDIHIYKATKVIFHKDL